MGLQSEAVLEKDLMTQLKELGYSTASIRNEDDINANLKRQLDVL